MLATRLEASLDMAGTAGRRWPPPVERAAYRTVQEALTDIGKHAPGAPTAVVVRACAEGLRGSVHNGPPPSPPARMVLPGGGHRLVRGVRDGVRQ